MLNNPTPAMETILNTIKAYDHIIISRHKQPDGDAVGSTLGLQRVLKASFPQKDVRVINEDKSEYMAFLGAEDEQVPDECYKDALVIVLDTGGAERISNSKYSFGHQLMVIDHHLELAPYGDINWVEPERSSLCEMIAALCAAYPEELIVDSQAATCIYTGMVTDSGRFRYEGVTGDTLRLAAFLLDKGIDTETLYAHLYLDEYKEMKFHAYVLNRMKVTEHGVAYMHITEKAKQQFGLSSEQACNAISYLGSLKDSLIWLAFIDNEDGTVRVRLRSRFVTVNELGEKYNGGGHACASGATLYNKRQIPLLIRDADKILEEYKASHDGWL